MQRSEYFWNMLDTSIRIWQFRLTKYSYKKSNPNRIQNCILIKLVQLTKEKEKETNGLISDSRVSVPGTLLRIR